MRHLQKNVRNYNIGSASHLVILGLPDDAELLCDIGKLLESHVNIHGISRDDIYRLIMTEPDANPSHYPRTEQSTGSSRQFQPLWIKKFPWIHYSYHVDGVFCCACVFFCPR